MKQLEILSVTRCSGSEYVFIQIMGGNIRFDTTEVPKGLNNSTKDEYILLETLTPTEEPAIKNASHQFLES